MRKSLMLALPALAAIACLVAAHFNVAAQKKGGEDRDTTPQLGKDWRALRDSMDNAYEQLQADAGVKPNKIVDDSIFLRRIYLDLTGAPPSIDEINAFAPGRKDANGLRGQAKREALVEKLLASPEFAQHMATWWRVIMTERQGDGIYHNYLQRYLEEALTDNKPWNEVVHGLIAAKGRTPDVPGLGFLLTFENDRVAMAGQTSKVFLGRQIQCAECHDHHYEAWTMSDFESYAAFFRFFNTRAEGDGADRYWYSVDGGVLSEADAMRRLRLTGKYKLPRYLGEKDWTYEKGKDLRTSLADWMTSADNAWFREMTVNRYLDYFMGVGFVNPVDDFNSFNTPALPVVMQVMGRDFAASGFDTRYLVRAIVTSRMYQREVSPNRTNRQDRVYYSRNFVRSLTPEMVERSILKVTGIDRLNPHLHVPDLPVEKLSEDEKQAKVVRDRIAGYKGNLRTLIRNAFSNEEVVKDVDDHDGSIMQALLFMNAQLLPDYLNNSLKEILARYPGKIERATAIFMTVLGREPSTRDKHILNATFANWKGGDDIFEDLFVALLNTTEFVNRQ
ncbi:MAG: DUF1549 domain-containing protein [Planctomycetes bacterium]|nr:DUF1549 domain-containing protein [Planctomycetota bacterium]MCW8136284.1 DUF1549 domain-containing protein [Planctomycetota bacterium]